MPASRTWPNIADLVPHSGVARLLTHIVSISPTGIDAIGAIPAGHPLATGGTAPSFLAIELGAQAAAAMEAVRRQTVSGTGAGRQMGSLVRIREAHFEQPSLPVDSPIHMTADLAGSAPPLAIYRLQGTVSGRVVVRAVISTHAGPIGEPS